MATLTERKTWRRTKPTTTEPRAVNRPGQLTPEEQACARIALGVPRPRRTLGFPCPADHRMGTGHPDTTWGPSTAAELPEAVRVLCGSYFSTRRGARGVGSRPRILY